MVARPSIARTSTLQRLSKDVQQFGDHFFSLLLANRSGYSTPEMSFEELLRHLIGGSRHCLELGDDIDTAASLFHHALDTAHLSLQAPEARDELILPVFVVIRWWLCVNHG
jgi:hypothetical protein